MLCRAAQSPAGDYPMLGLNPSRNMVSPEKNLPTSADAGKAKDDGGPVDLSTTQNVRWIAKLGSAAYGNVTIADGRVFIGTNNNVPRDPKYQGDHGIVLCLDEKTGALLWQLAAPKLDTGNVSDWEAVGICSSPTVDGDHVYIVTNRCEVLCLDVHGQAGGQNRGPFTDEAQYVAGPGKTPIAQGPNDADILWRFDMRQELGAFPQKQTSGSVLVVGDKLFVNTSNGVDSNLTRKHLPSPNCPAIICLDKNTGKLLAVERSGISRRTWICNWSSPAYGVIAGRPTVVMGGGDGYCYGFSTEIGPSQEPPAPAAPGDPPLVPTLKELWRFDCNPPQRHVKNGKPLQYGAPDGPSFVAASPVVSGDRVYIAIGQEPDQASGRGALNCIAPLSLTGDISAAGRAWCNPGVGLSDSTASVGGGLVYLADLSGAVHCLDGADGHELWKYDTQAGLYGSTLLADGKVYVGNENGQLQILAARRELKIIGAIDMKTPIHSTPVAANGVLYIATDDSLYALENKAAK